MLTAAIALAHADTYRPILVDDMERAHNGELSAVREGRCLADTSRFLLYKRQELRKKPQNSRKNPLTLRAQREKCLIFVRKMHVLPAAGRKHALSCDRNIRIPILT